MIDAATDYDPFKSVRPEGEAEETRDVTAVAGATESGGGVDKEGPEASGGGESREGTPFTVVGPRGRGAAKQRSGKEEGHDERGASGRGVGGKGAAATIFDYVRSKIDTRKRDDAGGGRGGGGEDRMDGGGGRGRGKGNGRSDSSRQRTKSKQRDADGEIPEMVPDRKSSQGPDQIIVAHSAPIATSRHEGNRELD